MDEVPRLWPAVDRQRPPRSNKGGQDRDDPGVGGRRVLAWPVDVKKAQAHRWHAVHAKGHGGVQFGAQLIHPVGGARPCQMTLRDGMGVARLAIHRCGRGVDDGCSLAPGGVEDRNSACLVGTMRPEPVPSFDRATEATAARWKHAAVPCTAERTSAASATSPTKSSQRGSRLARRPVERSSKMRTLWPPSTRASARCEPMKPAPPVTRKVAMRSLFLNRLLVDLYL